MPIHSSAANGRAELHLAGRLSHADTGEFRRKLDALLQDSPQALAIDLSQLDQMDSAGLGMLIVAQETCRQSGIPVCVKHPKGDVKQALVLTRSYERFTIVD